MSNKTLAELAQEAAARQRESAQDAARAAEVDLALPPSAVADRHERGLTDFAATPEPQRSGTGQKPPFSSVRYSPPLDPLAQVDVEALVKRLSTSSYRTGEGIMLWVAAAIGVACVLVGLLSKTHAEHAEILVSVGGAILTWASHRQSVDRNDTKGAIAEALPGIISTLSTALARPRDPSKKS